MIGRGDLGLDKRYNPGKTKAGSVKESYLTGINDKISKLLTLLDKNPYSKTYGCFDRNYWHYKIKDFPSGMSQEFVLALALAWDTNDSQNPFYKQKQISEYIQGAIQYTAVSSRSDGSTDDYFPYERALGAAVFSLYAATESYLILGFDSEEFKSFFKKRGRWLIENDESGTLSNHHAIAALALHNVYLITNEDTFKEAAQLKITEVLSWQDSEGWYQEYEGCDPGYLTVTIDFLAQYYKKTEDPHVLKSLENAVSFVHQIQHPDGTLGGEYGSRFTNIFHPNGFEILAPHNNGAAQIADAYQEARKNDLLPNMDDDYVMGHSVISNLNAFKNFSKRKAKDGETKKSGVVYFQNSGIYTGQVGDLWFIFNLLKGGVGRIYKKQKLIFCDSGAIADIGDKHIVSSFIDANSGINVEQEGVQISKKFSYYKQNYATPLIFLVFRKFLFLFGRFKWSSQFVRKYLQRKMILGRKPSDIVYVRKVDISNGQIRLVSSIKNAHNITKAHLSVGLVPMYIAVSECFDKSLLGQSFKSFKRKEGGDDSWELEHTFS